MTCQEILDFLMHYLDGELPPEQVVAFEEHLGECPPCVAYLKSYQEVVRLGKLACARESLCSEVPEDLVRAILAARKAK